MWCKYQLDNYPPNECMLAIIGNRMTINYEEKNHSA